MRTRTAYRLTGDITATLSDAASVLDAARRNLVTAQPSDVEAVCREMYSWLNARPLPGSSKEFCAGKYRFTLSFVILNPSKS